MSVSRAFEKTLLALRLGWFAEGFGTPRLINAKSLLDELRLGRRTMETIRQSLSVDPRRATADSLVVRVVASHLAVRLMRAIGSVLVFLPMAKSVVGTDRLWWAAAKHFCC